MTGRSQGVPSELAVKRGNISRQRAELASARANIESSQRRRSRMYGTNGLLGSLAVLGATLLGMMIPWLLEGAGLVPKGYRNAVSTVSILSCYALALVAYLIWVYRPAEGAGAPPLGSLPEASLASATEVERALDDLQRERRRLQLEAFAEPRLEMVAALSQGASGSTTSWVIGATLGPLAMAFTILAIVSASEGKSTDAALGAALAVLAAALAVGIITLLRRRARARRRAVLDLLSPLTRLMRGQVLATYAEAVAWFRENWAAPSRTEELYATPEFAAASAVMRGFPVLVEVEPRGASGEDYTYDPRINLYVAVRLPDDPAQLASTLAGLEQTGFKAQIYLEAGVCVRAKAARVKGLLEDPHGGERVLALMSQVVQAVEGRGARAWD